MNVIHYNLQCVAVGNGWEQLQGIFTHLFTESQIETQKVKFHAASTCQRQDTNLNLDFIMQQFDGLKILKISVTKQLDPIQNITVISVPDL